MRSDLDFRDFREVSFFAQRSLAAELVIAPKKFLTPRLSYKGFQIFFNYKIWNFWLESIGLFSVKIFKLKIEFKKSMLKFMHQKFLQVSIKSK